MRSRRTPRSYVTHEADVIGDRGYFTQLDNAMGTTWSYLDMTALGRQEEWEDSPDGYPHRARRTSVGALARRVRPACPIPMVRYPDPNDPNDQRPPAQGEGW